MPKIPGLGQAGALTPTVQRMVVQQGGSEAVAAGVRRLGNAIGAVAEDEALLQQKRQHEADNLKVAADSMQLGNDLAVLRQRTQDDLAGGAIASRQDALKRFQDESTQLLSDYNQKAPQRLRQAARLRGDELFQRETLAMGGFLDNHATSEARANDETVAQGLMTQGLASEQELARVKQARSDALDSNANALRYTPEQVATLKQKFNADATFLNLSQKLAEKPDDIKGIRALKTRLADEKQLTDLDPARRIQLEHQATSLENQWEAEQRRIKAESEAKLTASASDMRDFLLNGGDTTKLDASGRQQLNTLLGSQKYGKDARGWLDQNQKVANFNTLPIPAQAAALTAAESARRGTTSVDDFNQQTDVLNAMQRNFNRNLQDYKTDPLTYTTSNLMKQDVTPINWQDTATIPQQLRARREQAEVASQMNGSRVPPVTAADASTIATLANAMPPQQSARFLSLVRQGVGDDNMPLVAQMMGKHADPVFVGASILSGKTTDAGRDAAELALRGRDVIKGKEIKLPEETRMRANFAQATGLSGDGLEYAFQTAQAIYAAKARERGVIEPVNGQPDARLWRDSVAVATGGVYQYNGRNLIAPRYGMKQSDFEDALAAVKPADIARDAGNMKLFVDGQEIGYDKAAKFVQEAPVGNGSRAGTVWVRAGAGMLMKQDGTPFLLTIPPVQR